MGEYVTKGKDCSSRLLTHKKWLEEQGKEANPEPEEELDEDEQAQREMESQLAKQAWLKKQEDQKKQREKARKFSKEMNKGEWKPKTAVTVLDTKKKKKLKKLLTDVVQSPDEEEGEADDEPLPEGFRLQADSVHCLNICKAEHFQAYLQQICGEFVNMVKIGRGVDKEYQKVVRSVFWACQVVGNRSLMNGVDPERVARSVRDLNSVTWRQKLMGKDKAILKELFVDEEEDPQVASEKKTIDKNDVFAIVKNNMDQLLNEKWKELGFHIQGIIQSNAQAHKYVAQAAEHLADASRLLTTPSIVALVNSTMRPLVGVHLPLVEEFT